MVLKRNRNDVESIAKASTAPGYVKSLPQRNLSSPRPERQTGHQGKVQRLTANRADPTSERTAPRPHRNEEESGESLSLPPATALTDCLSVRPKDHDHEKRISRNAECLCRSVRHQQFSTKTTDVEVRRIESRPHLLHCRWEL